MQCIQSSLLKLYPTWGHSSSTIHICCGFTGNHMVAWFDAKNTRDKHLWCCWPADALAPLLPVLWFVSFLFLVAVLLYVSVTRCQSRAMVSLCTRSSDNPLTFTKLPGTQFPGNHVIVGTQHPKVKLNQTQHQFSALIITGQS